MEMIEIGKLKPYQPDGMPKLTAHEREELKKLIEASGVTDSLIVSEDGDIIDGNHRYEICLELNIAEVPCVVKRYEDEADKFSDAVLYQLARRNLKTHQRYLLAYRFWQKFGLKGDATKGGRPGKEKNRADSVQFSREQIVKMFGFKSKSRMRDAIIPYGNAHDFLIDAEGKWNHPCTYSHEHIEDWADRKGVQSVIDFASDLALGGDNKGEAKKIKKENIYANVRVVDGAYKQFTAEELLANKECMIGVWDYIVLLKGFLESHKEGEFKKVNHGDYSITICVTKRKE